MIPTILRLSLFQSLTVNDPERAMIIGKRPFKDSRARDVVVKNESPVNLEANH